MDEPHSRAHGVHGASRFGVQGDFCLTHITTQRNRPLILSGKKVYLAETAKNKICYFTSHFGIDTPTHSHFASHGGVDINVDD